MVITEAIPNVRTPMWSTNDHGLQDTPCFAFRGWTWNPDFHWFPVFPSSTSNETMNSPTLSEKKIKHFNESLSTGLLRDKWQAPRRDLPVTVCLTLFWLFQAAEQILLHWVPNEHMFFNVFPRFLPSPGASNHRKPGFSFVWELSTWVVGFMEILGPRVLAETELPTSTQNDIERQWPCQKGLNKINQPPSAPGYFQIKRGWMKNYQNVKKTVKHHQPPSNTNKHQ